MSPQVLLIGAGFIFIAGAIIGGGDFVKIKLPHLPVWARAMGAAIGITAFILGLRPGIYTITSSPDNSSKATSSPAASPALSSPSSTPIANPVLTIKQPNPNLVSRTGGFVATGSVSNLGAYTIWLLDYRSGYYYIDVQATLHPDGHTWSAADRQLGSATDALPFRLTAVVVLATHDCATTLKADIDSSNTRLNSLPAGCQIVQPTVTVTVDRES